MLLTSDIADANIILIRSSGIFNITLSIPPDFPESQPRIKFETPIFHHRVSSAGYLCYSPTKSEEISSHLEAVVKAIDDENAVYDPRAVVNPGAFALYWGGDDKKKFYNRKLRRSAQESTEVS
jgi:ubiquitin-conjugating enzyme E2 Z